MANCPAWAFAAGPARDALLQHLHDETQCADVRLTDKEMNVLRHDNVTEQREIVAVANLLEDFQEDVAASFGSKKRESAIATAGDEVQVAGIVVTL